MKKLYKSFLEGYIGSPNLISHKSIVTDSSFGGTSGKFIVSISKETSFPYNYVYNYVTMANGHYYIIGTYSTEDLTDNSYSDAFFRSISFPSNKIRENDLRIYDGGFKVGKMPGYTIGFLIILAVIAIAICLTVKRMDEMNG